MPRFIIKPDRELDLYVDWSTIVDAPCMWGTREEMLAAGVTLERLDRAEATGSSCAGEIADLYSWSHQMFMYLQEGVLSRTRMAELLDRLSVDRDADVSDLLAPFDDDAPLAREDVEVRS